MGKLICSICELARMVEDGIIPSDYLFKTAISSLLQSKHILEIYEILMELLSITNQAQILAQLPQIYSELIKLNRFDLFTNLITKIHAAHGKEQIKMEEFLSVYLNEIDDYPYVTLQMIKLLLALKYQITEDSTRIFLKSIVKFDENKEKSIQDVYELIQEHRAPFSVGNYSFLICSFIESQNFSTINFYLKEMRMKGLKPSNACFTAIISTYLDSFCTQQSHRLSISEKQAQPTENQSSIHQKSEKEKFHECFGLISLYRKINTFDVILVKYIIQKLLENHQFFYAFHILLDFYPQFKRQSELITFDELAVELIAYFNELPDAPWNKLFINYFLDYLLELGHTSAKLAPFHSQNLPESLRESDSNVILLKLFEFSKNVENDQFSDKELLELNRLFFAYSKTLGKANLSGATNVENFGKIEKIFLGMPEKMTSLLLTSYLKIAILENKIEEIEKLFTEKLGKLPFYQIPSDLEILKLIEVVKENQEGGDSTITLLNYFMRFFNFQPNFQVLGDLFHYFLQKKNVETCKMAISFINQQNFGQFEAFSIEKHLIRFYTQLIYLILFNHSPCIAISSKENQKQIKENLQSSEVASLNENNRDNQEMKLDDDFVEQFFASAPTKGALTLEKVEEAKRLLEELIQSNLIKSNKNSSSILSSIANNQQGGSEVNQNQSGVFNSPPWNQPPSAASKGSFFNQFPSLIDSNLFSLVIRCYIHFSELNAAKELILKYRKNISLSSTVFLDLMHFYLIKKSLPLDETKENLKQFFSQVNLLPTNEISEKIFNLLIHHVSKENASLSMNLIDFVNFLRDFSIYPSVNNLQDIIEILLKRSKYQEIDALLNRTKNSGLLFNFQFDPKILANFVKENKHDEILELYKIFKNYFWTPRPPKLNRAGFYQFISDFILYFQSSEVKKEFYHEKALELYKNFKVNLIDMQKLHSPLKHSFNQILMNFLKYSRQEFFAAVHPFNNIHEIQFINDFFTTHPKEIDDLFSSLDQERSTNPAKFNFFHSFYTLLPNESVPDFLRLVPSFQADESIFNNFQRRIINAKVSPAVLEDFTVQSILRGFTSQINLRLFISKKNLHVKNVFLKLLPSPSDSSSTVHLNEHTVPIIHKFLIYYLTETPPLLFPPIVHPALSSFLSSHPNPELLQIFEQLQLPKSSNTPNKSNQ